MKVTPTIDYMFSGIIEEIGLVEELKKTRDIYNLIVKGKAVSEDTRTGDSVCVNGVCLTVTGCRNSSISFDIIHETMRRTNLERLKRNDAVNLERSLKLQDRISGHFVTGHIDDVGRIEKRFAISKDTCFVIALEPQLSSYIAPKGSIAVDGVSLTIGEVMGNKFRVYLIPHTLKVTTLGQRRVGDIVNIEIDILARYVRSFLKSH